MIYLKQSWMGYPVIGKYDPFQLVDECIIIAVGDNQVRKQISLTIKHHSGIAMHSSAVIDRLSFIDVGTVVLHNSVIQRGTKIGRHCIINTCASIDHDCTVDDFVHISPNATLCGNVTVGEGTHIGAGAVILPNITLGSWCKIGAGSVVIRDLPDACIAMGIPARIKNSCSK